MPKHQAMNVIPKYAYRYFICVPMFKILLHNWSNGLLKVIFIQWRNNGFINTAFLSGQE